MNGIIAQIKSFMKEVPQIGCPIEHDGLIKEIRTRNAIVIEAAQSLLDRTDSPRVIRTQVRHLVVYFIIYRLIVL